MTSALLTPKQQDCLACSSARAIALAECRSGCAIVRSVLMMALGAYCIASIGGSVGMGIGPVCLGMGGSILLLAALNIYELHHEKACCCAKSTLEKWLVRCYTFFTAITLAIAVWILTSESTLLTAVEDLCDQTCLDEIIATFSAGSSNATATGNSSTEVVLHQHAHRINHTAVASANTTTVETNTELAKGEFAADFGAKINDTGWFLLLISLFLVLQTLLNFGHMRCIKKDEGKQAIPRDSVTAADGAKPLRSKKGSRDSAAVP